MRIFIWSVLVLLMHTALIALGSIGLATPQYVVFIISFVVGAAAAVAVILIWPGRPRRKENGPA